MKSIKILFGVMFVLCVYSNNLLCYDSSCTIKMFINISDKTVNPNDSLVLNSDKFQKYYCFKEARISNRFVDSGSFIPTDKLSNFKNYILLYISNPTQVDTLLIPDSKFMILNSKVVKKDSTILNLLQEYIPILETESLYKVLQ